MKRMVSLLLVLLLCLSLSACGLMDRAKYGRYYDLIGMLESGDYAGAHAEIDRIAGGPVVGESAAEPAPDAPENPGTPEPSEEPRPDWFHLIYGDWNRLSSDDEGKVETVTLREDGTGLLDGSEVLWVLYSLNEANDTVCIDLFQDETQIGEFRCEYMEDGDLRAYVQLEASDNQTLYVYKPTHYEMISVTADNWQDYFEYRNEMHYQDNAFGEFDRCWYTTKLYLKPEYAGRTSAYLMDDVFDDNVIPNGAIEISYDYGDTPFHMNKETREYSFGEPSVEGSSTYITELSYNDTDGFHFYIAWHNFGEYELEDETAYDFRHNCVPIRLEMTLCLFAE